MWVERVMLLATVAACGDDSPSGSVDASTSTDDGSTDAAIVEAPCDFTEAADGTNNTVAMAEATSLTLAARITLCGNVDTGHFAQQIVDADAYKFSIGAETDVMMHIHGTGLDTPATMIIELRQGGDYFGFGVVEGGHATLIGHLPPGDYTATMAAANAADLGAALPYRITIVPDMPATRCPKATTAGYTESNDGGSNTGNDVISYAASSNTPSTLTSATGDMPEPSGITVMPAMRYLISGSSANVNPADDYEDRDTFAFTTGATTTQLSIRLNWTSTTMDLDYRVYPVSTSDPLSIVGGLAEAQSEPEFQTFAVTANTTYWLWIAAADGATGQPAPYEATLCGELFTP